MQTNKAVIVMVTFSLSVLAILAVGTICYLSYLKIEVPPELNTLAGGLVGALTAMLVKTSPSEATKSVDDRIPDLTPGGAAAKVEVVNKPEDPVPTVEKP